MVDELQEIISLLPLETEEDKEKYLDIQMALLAIQAAAREYEAITADIKQQVSDLEKRQQSLIDGYNTQMKVRQEIQAEYRKENEIVRNEKALAEQELLKQIMAGAGTRNYF